MKPEPSPRPSNVDETPRSPSRRLDQRLSGIENSLEDLHAAVSSIRSGLDDLPSDEGPASVLSPAGETSDGFYLRLAEEVTNAGTWDWDLLGRQVDGSRSLWSMLGLDDTPHAADVKLFRSLLHPDDRESVFARVQDTLISGDNAYEEFRLLRADGQVRWLAVRAKVFREGSGIPIRMVGISFDITDRKIAEETLRTADRRKDEFLAMLAHELRNPLAAITNAFGLIREPNLTAANRQWASEMLERQLAQLGHLIDDLLDISRITQGKVDLKKQPLTFNALVERVVDMHRPRFREARIDLKANVAAEALWVAGDPTRLEQVVVNLLTNAVKYTKENGRVLLTLGKSAGHAVLAVKDTGIGISLDMLPRVFDLFSQSERGLDRSQGGLGIGLTLVKRLLEMHDGTVTVTSPGVGKGSEFQVRLPLLETPAAQEQRPQVLETELAGKRRVLVVDDNVDAAFALSLLLKLSGHMTAIAHNASEGLALVEDFRPDAAVLDIGLPGMNGFELAEELRKISPNITLIALSGYGQPEDFKRSKQAGFDEHLVKPVMHEQLLALLGQLA